MWGSQTLLTSLFKHDTFSLLPNLHTCISLVEVYLFRECLGWTFSPISTFFSLVSSRAFRNTPHSRFRCRDPKQSLPNFLKMLLLALPQIYTQVKYTSEIWKRAKTSIFKKRGKQSLGSPHLKRKCAAALNVREHAGEKKSYMGNNI